VLVLFLALAASVAACSGAKDPAADSASDSGTPSLGTPSGDDSGGLPMNGGDDGGGGGTPLGGGGGGVPSTDAGGMQGGDDGGGASNEGGPATDGGGNNGGGDGGGLVAPSACPASGATNETEPNDTMAQANAFTDTACGAIDPASDVDWWKFTLSASAKTIALAYHGQVKLVIQSQGDTVTLPGSTSIPFHPGADYFVTVTSASGNKESYTLVQK
jgi:hypothetical protein